MSYAKRTWEHKGQKYGDGERPTSIDWCPENGAMRETTINSDGTWERRYTYPKNAPMDSPMNSPKAGNPYLHTSASETPTQNEGNTPCKNTGCPNVDPLDPTQCCFFHQTDIHWCKNYAPSAVEE